MLKIARRCGLTDPSGARFIRHLHREEAGRLLALGAIAANGTRGDVIVEFRLTNAVQLKLTDARAGSFGVWREHFPTAGQYGLNGGVVFSPLPTYAEMIAA